ncbi:MAG: hypothetical protein ACLGI5_01490 [Thermoleophilia bacterium]
MAGGAVRRTIMELPPGASTTLREDGAVIDFPMWAYWLRIAHDHAAEAERERPTDDYIDRIADALAAIGSEVEPAEHEDDGDLNRSTRAAMTALVAAAIAVDGFYGTVAEVAPRVEAGARHSIILETLKVAFAIGALQQRWAKDLKWLFKTRDTAVHHAAAPRQVVTVRETDRTVVVGAPEAASFAADQARRAADLAIEIVTTCLANPKTLTRDLASRYGYITPEDLRGEHVDSPEP